MDKNREEVTGLSEEELQKEADTVREMLEQSPDLQEIEVPEELERKLAERIRKYEEEKAIDALSEKDKEALRLGRELQEKESSEKRDSKKNKKAVRWPKSWKVQFAAVIACVLVIGSGIISVGGKNIIVNVFDRKFGGGEKTYVDTDEIVVNTELTEEEAYAKVEETFGTKVVRMVYKPENTVFLEVQIHKDLQEAIFYYKVNDKTMSYRIEFPYSESSGGVEIQDELLQEYMIKLPKVVVEISEYKVPSIKIQEFEAQFSYKNSKYFLIGLIEQNEFEKIVKNLNFF